MKYETGKTKWMPLYTTAGLALALGLSACGDKTLDDYQRDRVNQEIAKINAISGTYRGTPTSGKDGSPMGAVSLSVRSVVRSKTTSDGLTTQAQAAIHGVLSYDGATNAELVFDQGYFESETNNFNATVTIQTAAGQSEEIAIRGNFSNGKFTGQLEPYRFPNSAANMVLIKDGPMPASGALSGPGRIGMNAVDVSTGSAALSDRQCAMTMTLTSNQTTPEQQFLDFFLPVRDVSVLLDCDGDVQIFTQNGHIDDRTGSLDAKFLNSSGFYNFQDKLHCTRLQGAAGKGWDCMLSYSKKPASTHLILRDQNP